MSDHQDPDRCGNCGWARETENVEQVQCSVDPPKAFPIVTPQGLTFAATLPMCDAMNGFCQYHKRGQIVKLAKIVRLPPGAGIKGLVK